MEHLLLTSVWQQIILEAFPLKFEKIYSLLNPNFETILFDWEGFIILGTLDWYMVAKWLEFC